MPSLFSCSIRKNRTLADALRDGRWIQDLRGRVNAQNLHEFVELWGRAAAVTLRTGSDGFRWRFSAAGTYSATSAYLLQFSGATRSNLRASIWSIKAPAKCKFYLWLLEKRRLLTADVLLC